MKVSGYTPEELTLFRAVLAASMNEMLAVDQHIPLELMARRLFKAAESGEREPRRLVEAVLNLKGSASSSAPSESKGVFGGSSGAMSQPV